MSGSSSAPAIPIPGNFFGPDVVAWVEINRWRVLQVLMGKMIDEVLSGRECTQLRPGKYGEGAPISPSRPLVPGISKYALDWSLGLFAPDRQSLINIISNYGAPSRFGLDGIPRME